MGELPLAAVDRVIRKATGIRVSEEAARVLYVAATRARDTTKEE
mgnify:CR=1 FL=1